MQLHMNRKTKYALAGALMLLPFMPCAVQASGKQGKEVRIRIVQTTDVHGRFFPYDFIKQEPADGSLARVSSYVDSLRNIYRDRLVLLDAGDVLQGQPVVSYFNYVKTDVENIAASINKYMRYDVQTIGNHDIETGHSVYDKWAREIGCPMLGANVIDTATGQPYFKPYVMLRRGGLKIAVIGVTTPGVPSWLSEQLWSGLRFDDAVATARKWLEIVKAKEKPDVVVGLFHTGTHDHSLTNGFVNDATEEIARTVPGFDVIFYGHDHAVNYKEVESADGSTTIIVNPANNAMRVADAEIVVGKSGKKLNVNVVDVAKRAVDRRFVETFKPQTDEVEKYVMSEVGSFTAPMTSRDCYFGNSSLVDFIHDVMLKASGAEVSFASPLSFDVTVKSGPVTLADMYKLYSYENDLCMMDLTGEEIRRYLEMSYSKWVATMQSPGDHLLKMRAADANRDKFFGLASAFYNLDSAAGIDYEVDVTKPAGSRVHILSMADGTPFDESRHYRVALNSYRASGGGGLLTKGAGIDKALLDKRILWRGDRNMREYIIDYIRQMKTITPQSHDNWRFVPAAWTGEAAKRDRMLLFPDDKK